MAKKRAKEAPLTTTELVSIIISFIALVFSVLSYCNGINANYTANHSNEIAEQANTLSNQSIVLAKEANSIAKELTNVSDCELLAGLLVNEPSINESDRLFIKALIAEKDCDSAKLKLIASLQKNKTSIGVEVKPITNEKYTYNLNYAFIGLLMLTVIILLLFLTYVIDKKKKKNM